MKVLKDIYTKKHIYSHYQPTRQGSPTKKSKGPRYYLLNTPQKKEKNKKEKEKLTFFSAKPEFIEAEAQRMNRIKDSLKLYKRMRMMTAWHIIYIRDRKQDYTPKTKPKH